MKKTSEEEIADKVCEELLANGRPQKMKVRTLLGKFGFERRTEDNVARITELLSERNIMINPSITKLGDNFQIQFDDRVQLSERNDKAHLEIHDSETLNIYDYNSDPWLVDVKSKEFRTEKEVENKFILPLLSRLGYSEDDRFDGMPVKASLGCKPTTLIVDFALFNKENENIEGQTMLVVEAKREERLIKQKELENARNQAKSYAVWTSCHYGLVTDSSIIQVLDLFPKNIGDMVLFECKREELKENFKELYSYISKESLTKYYENISRNS